MMFYSFNQNNSGGSFVLDKKAGITHFVIIEAKSVEDANQRAEAIGLYFDGCNDGRDCDCCGDRWSSASKWNESVKPKIYNLPINLRKKLIMHATEAKTAWRPDGKNYMMTWMEDGFEAVIHYLNGKVVWLGAERPPAKKGKK